MEAPPDKIDAELLEELDRHKTPGCLSETVLGQYIVIVHDGSWSTVYGHLSARRVRLNDRVESGMIIGNVGSTGESTGPHLHFEVRSRGEPRDPGPLIPQVRK